MPKKTKKPTLILIDAHAYIHRAYHALPDFTDKEGEPAGALYGLASMLVKLLNDLSPDYVVAAYDLPEPTHRHEVYEAYKGERAEIDEALIDQLNRSRDIFKAFNIPIYEAPGFEADDVIGTFADSLKKDYDIVIASGDMDTLQLVDKKSVKVFTARKGLSDTVLYDEDAVQDRFGFAPQYIPDYKGFAGDSSDNIIGISGVGAKTATKLIQAYGSMEAIYKALHKNADAFKEKAGVSERVFNLLKDGQEEAEFSKVLATVRVDTPVSFDAEGAHWKENFSAAEAKELMSDLGFRSLTDRVGRLGEGVAADSTEPEEEVEENQTPEYSSEEQQLLAEAKVMVWLLHSDTTNPSDEDVFSAAGADTPIKAHQALTKQLKEEDLYSVFTDIEQPLIKVIHELNARGIRVDTAYLADLSKQYHKTLDALAKRIFKQAGVEFNLNSPKQLGEVLFERLEIKQARTKKTATGQASTSESVLVKLQDEHPIVKDILEYRGLQKLLSTYIDAIPPLLSDDGRLRTTFVQTGTTTGRLSSRDPNLQNIPIKSESGRRIRKGFVASKGKVLVTFDYSQIELKLAAFLSGDEKLKTIFINEEDVHTAVAAEVFGVPPEQVEKEMRRRAKVINFGILYGMGVNALKEQLGTERAEAQDYLNRYFERFTGLASYLTRTKASAAQLGYTKTLFGRKRYFPGIKSHLPFVRASAERMAINAPIQGTQADIVKMAMVQADALIKKSFKDKAGLVLQIHDELMFEVEEAVLDEFAQKIRTLMESVLPPDKIDGIRLSVSAEAGPSWAELTDIVDG
ncbi:MAG: DNA polymerase [Patescibacteria group bacterium UBA2163]